MRQFRYTVAAHAGGVAFFTAASRAEFEDWLGYHLGDGGGVFAAAVYLQFYELEVAEIRCASGRLLFGRQELPPVPDRAGVAATAPEATP